MFTTIIGFITSGWKNLMVKLGIVALVFALGFGGGWKVGTSHYKLQEAVQATQTLTDVGIRKTGQQGVTDSHEQHQITVQTKIVNHYIPIEHDIQVYQTQPEGKVVIGKDAVELFNKAIASPNASDAGVTK